MNAYLVVSPASVSSSPRQRIPPKPSGSPARNGASDPVTSGVEYLVYTQEKSRKEAMVMFLPKNKRPPIPVTLNDCVLLHQMGYRVEVNDGRFIAVAREKRKRKTA